MSLSDRHRRLSVAPLAGVERQGRGSLGSGRLAVGISDSLPSGSHFIQGTHPFSGVLPQFHQGQSSGRRGPVFIGQGSDRACSSSFSRLLQPVVCGVESLRSVEAGHRPLATESEGAADILQDGDSPVRTSVSTRWGLDGVSRFEGCVLAGSDASGISQVPQVHVGRECVPVQSSLLWTLHRSSGFHPGHGSCFRNPSQDRGAFTSLSRRLVDSGLLSGAGSPCSGDSTAALRDFGNSCQLGEVSADSNTADGISRSRFGLNLFQGFSCPEESREASLNWRRILVLCKTACIILTRALRSAVVHDPARTWRTAPNEILPVYSSETLESCRSVCSGGMDSGDSPGFRLVAGSRSSGVRRVSGAGVPSARLVVRRLGRGLGGSSRRGSCFRPLGSRGIRHFHQCQGALGKREGSSLVRSSNLRLLRINFRRQRYGSSLSQESGRDTFVTSQFHRSEDSPLGGVASSPAVSSVHHGKTQCSGGFVVSSESGPGLRVDSEAGGISGAAQEVAGFHRPVRHL